MFLSLLDAELNGDVFGYNYLIHDYHIRPNRAHTNKATTWPLLTQNAMCQIYIKNECFLLLCVCNTGNIMLDYEQKCVDGCV